MPTYRSLALFAGPALALWVTGPLMSLIDSSAVGLSGSVQALAALGPATTFVDGASYLFAFISVATTNCLATAATKGDDEEARLVVATAIRCALRCGLGVMALMLAAAPQMMGLYVGGASGAAVVVPASRYIRIRALSMPGTSRLVSSLPSFLPPSLPPSLRCPSVQLCFLTFPSHIHTNQPTNQRLKRNHKRGAGSCCPTRCRQPSSARELAHALWPWAPPRPSTPLETCLVCGAKLGLSGAPPGLSQWAGLAFLLRAANKTPHAFFSFSFSSSGGGGGGAEKTPPRPRPRASLG